MTSHEKQGLHEPLPAPQTDSVTTASLIESGFLSTSGDELSTFTPDSSHFGDANDDLPPSYDESQAQHTVSPSQSIPSQNRSNVQVYRTELPPQPHIAFTEKSLVRDPSPNSGPSQILSEALVFTRTPAPPGAQTAHNLSRPIAIPSLPGKASPLQFARFYAKVLQLCNVTPEEFMHFVDGLNAVCKASSSSAASLKAADYDAELRGTPPITTDNLLAAYMSAANYYFFIPRGIRVKLLPLEAISEKARIAPEARPAIYYDLLRAYRVGQELPAAANGAATSVANLLEPYVEPLSLSVPEPGSSADSLSTLADRLASISVNASTTSTPTADQAGPTVPPILRTASAPQPDGPSRPDPPQSSQSQASGLGWGAIGRVIGNLGEQHGRAIGAWGEQQGRAWGSWGEQQGRSVGTWGQQQGRAWGGWGAGIGKLVSEVAAVGVSSLASGRGGPIGGGPGRGPSGGGPGGLGPFGGGSFLGRGGFGGPGGPRGRGGLGGPHHHGNWGPPGHPHSPGSLHGDHLPPSQSHGSFPPPPQFHGDVPPPPAPQGFTEGPGSGQNQYVPHPAFTPHGYPNEKHHHHHHHYTEEKSHRSDKSKGKGKKKYDYSDDSDSDSDTDSLSSFTSSSSVASTLLGESHDGRDYENPDAIFQRKIEDIEALAAAARTAHAKTDQQIEDERLAALSAAAEEHERQVAEREARLLKREAKRERRRAKHEAKKARRRAKREKRRERRERRLGGHGGRRSERREERRERRRGGGDRERGAPPVERAPGPRHEELLGSRQRGWEARREEMQRAREGMERGGPSGVTGGMETGVEGSSASRGGVFGPGGGGFEGRRVEMERRRGEMERGVSASGSTSGGGLYDGRDELVWIVVEGVGAE